MRLLVGVGGTDASVRALERALERAGATGDDLTVAIVDDPAVDADREAIESTVSSIVASAEQSVSIRHVAGDPGPELVAIAESEGFDRIVIGGGTRSPMGKIEIGSFVEFVLLNAHVSVTLIR